VRKQDPFGNPRGTAVAWPNPHGFVGGTNDEPGALVHLGARMYNPAIGRFLSDDPITNTGDPQSLNGYAYANNNPTTSSDPGGTRTCNGSAEDCGTGPEHGNIDYGNGTTPGSSAKDKHGRSYYRKRPVVKPVPRGGCGYAGHSRDKDCARSTNVNPKADQWAKKLAQKIDKLTRDLKSHHVKDGIFSIGNISFSYSGGDDGATALVACLTTKGLCSRHFIHQLLKDTPVVRLLEAGPGEEIARRLEKAIGGELGANAEMAEAVEADTAGRMRLSRDIRQLVRETGYSKKEVGDAIHVLKHQLEQSGVRNDDLQIDLNTGEAYPKGGGDSVGNIYDILDGSQY
jgi:RHS repeat-associated protein